MQKRESPRLSLRARRILAAVFNLINIVIYGAIGIYGVVSEAYVGSILCFAVTVLFIIFLVWSQKALKDGEKVLSKHPAKPLKVICAVTAWVMAVSLIIQLAATVFIYEFVFNDYFETYEPYSLSTDVFPGLKVSECTFPSNKGQMLAGYIYTKDDSSPKGVLVISHGFGGGGQNAYMAVANYFASNGYIVFAYDATGNDKSEGGATGGLPQGLYDLDYAIRYVESNEMTRDLPVVLFGHSWGAYSASNVLNIHPEVKAIVAVSGFERSSDMLLSYAENYAGPIAELSLPFVNSYERIKFGKIAEYTAIDGFENSDAGVFVVHSEDDTTVLIKYGFELYYNKYKDDDRFVFVKYEDRGHGRPFYSDASREYIDEFNKHFAIDFDYADKVDPEEKAKYLHEHLDKAKMYDLDDELFAKMLDFYDSYTIN